MTTKHNVHSDITAHVINGAHGWRMVKKELNFRFGFGSESIIHILIGRGKKFLANRILSLQQKKSWGIDLRIDAWLCTDEDNDDSTGIGNVLGFCLCTWQSSGKVIIDAEEESENALRCLIFFMGAVDSCDIGNVDESTGTDNVTVVAD